ncbi:GntR family transcriptional regulator [Holdemania massiliensis]|uniref:GntR family transcriptional regulator n=1 Tax=Holdemania massiliensis TaxID=1468449 RepID=UPI003522DDCC
MNDEVYVTRQLDQFESITQALEARGFHYAYPILNQSVMEANKLISEQLQIPIATRVFSYRKLRIVEDKPRSIEQVYIEYEKVRGIENLSLENQSLYRVLRRQFGYDIRRNEEEIRIVHASEEEAQLLHVEEDAEILMSTGLTYLDSVKPFEYFQIVAIPSFFKFRSVTTV